jgi:hypothetical protein
MKIINNSFNLKASKNPNFNIEIGFFFVFKTEQLKFKSKCNYP